MSLVSAGHWQVEVSATDESLSQSNPTECARACVCVIECDQAKLYPSTPTMSRWKRVGIRNTLHSRGGVN